jgi:hypothetical protein
MTEHLQIDFAIQRIEERTSLAAATANHVPTPSSLRSGPPEAKYEETQRLLQVAKRITVYSFHTAVRCPLGIVSNQDSLTFMSVMLCFIHFVSQAKRGDTA